MSPVLNQISESIADEQVAYFKAHGSTPETALGAILGRVPVDAIYPSWTDIHRLLKGHWFVMQGQHG
jgi:hypothetical protein